jgi:hypothetical protein
MATHHCSILTARNRQRNPKCRPKLSLPWIVRKSDSNRYGWSNDVPERHAQAPLARDPESLLLRFRGFTETRPSTPRQWYQRIVAMILAVSVWFPLAPAPIHQVGDAADYHPSARWQAGSLRVIMAEPRRCPPKHLACQRSLSSSMTGSPPEHHARLCESFLAEGGHPGNRYEKGITPSQAPRPVSRGASGSCPPGGDHHYAADTVAVNQATITHNELQRSAIVSLQPDCRYGPFRLRCCTVSLHLWNCHHWHSPEGCP